MRRMEWEKAHRESLSKKNGAEPAYAEWMHIDGEDHGPFKSDTKHGIRITYDPLYLNEGKPKPSKAQRRASPAKQAHPIKQTKNRKRQPTVELLEAMKRAAAKRSKRIVSRDDQKGIVIERGPKGRLRRILSDV